MNKIKLLLASLAMAMICLLCAEAKSQQKRGNCIVYNNYSFVTPYQYYGSNGYFYYYQYNIASTPQWGYQYYQVTPYNWNRYNRYRSQSQTPYRRNFNPNQQSRYRN